jgi:hypothetical protein
MCFHNGSDSECASDFVQMLERVRRRPWKVLEKHSRMKAWAIHRKSKLTETEKGETGEEQNQEHDHFFLH